MAPRQELHCINPEKRNERERERLNKTTILSDLLGQGKDLITYGIRQKLTALAEIHKSIQRGIHRGNNAVAIQESEETNIPYIWSEVQSYQEHNDLPTRIQTQCDSDEQKGEEKISEIDNYDGIKIMNIGPIDTSESFMQQIRILKQVLSLYPKGLIKKYCDTIIFGTQSSNTLAHANGWTKAIKISKYYDISQDLKGVIHHELIHLLFLHVNVSDFYTGKWKALGKKSEKTEDYAYHPTKTLAAYGMKNEDEDMATIGQQILTGQLVLREGQTPLLQAKINKFYELISITSDGIMTKSYIKAMGNPEYISIFHGALDSISNGLINQQFWEKFNKSTQIEMFAIFEEGIQKANISRGAAYLDLIEQYTKQYPQYF